MQLTLGIYMVVEKLLAWCIVPRLRAALLRLLGAQIGTNVRIYEVRFINLKNGFKNLNVGNDVHIGSECLLDLEGQISIGHGSTLSPRVLVLSHQDPGSAHNSPLIANFPPSVGSTIIGENCWIGANVTLLSGVTVGNGAVIGASSLVSKSIPESCLAAGVPAKSIKAI